MRTKFSEDGGKYTWQHEVLSDAPDEAKQHALLQLREAVGRELYGILQSKRSPAVVEIDENIQIRPTIIRDLANFGMRDLIKITVCVTPVKYNDVYFERLHEVDFRAFKIKPNWFSKLFKRLRGKP